MVAGLDADRDEPTLHRLLGDLYTRTGLAAESFDETPVPPEEIPPHPALLPRGERGNKKPSPRAARGQGEGARARYRASATWPFSRRRRSRFAKDSALMMRSNWLR